MSTKDHELNTIITAVEARELSAISAADRAVQLGFLLIGTVLPQPLHHPVELRYFSRSINAWTLIGAISTEKNNQKYLMATSLGKAAVTCAFFGDYNDLSEKGQRGTLGSPLTTELRPHFGFTEDEDYPGEIRIEALPELALAARRKGTLKGWIDLIPNDDFELCPELGPGQYISQGYKAPGAPYPTAGSIPVFSGRDAPSIVAIERARSIFDPPETT